MSGSGLRADQLLRELQVEFPRLRVVKKENDTFSKWIAVLLRVCTFNGQRTYMTEYTTVIGHTIFVPSRWDERSDADRYITLRHEAVHLRQMRRMGFVRMALQYGLVFFPIGFAYGRARIEWEAYAETLQAYADVHGWKVANAPSLRAHIVKQFTSGAYGWMWPFPRTIHAWIDEELTLIAARLGVPSARS